MKFISAAVVFFLALGLSVTTFANDTKTCTPETENCAPHGVVQGSAHGNALSEHMNSLFPEKQQNVNFSTVPTAVKLTSPKFLATVSTPSVQFQWTAAEGATSYQIQVATDPNFKWLVTNENFVETNSYMISDLQPGQKYYWRIASLKGENDSMFTKSLFVSSVFVTPAAKQ